MKKFKLAVLLIVISVGMVTLSVVIHQGLVADASTHANQVPAIITGAGPGGSPHVRVFDRFGKVESTPSNLFVFAQSFPGGVFVTAGDVDQDGEDEIIAAPRAGGGPQVRVFEKDGTAKSLSLQPFSASSRTGVSIAAGDIEGDGKDEIAVAPTSGDVATVKIYRYNSGKTVVSQWVAFGSVKCGASLAMADIDSDGKDEVIVGAGPGGGPQVKIYEPDGKLKYQFFAFDQNYRGGIDVAAGDLNGDGRADEVVVTKQTGISDLKIIKLDSKYTTLGTWRAFGQAANGAFVDVADIDQDGRDDIVVGAGSGGGPQVLAYDRNGKRLDVNFFAYDKNLRGGTDVAAGFFTAAPVTPTPTSTSTPTPTPTPTVTPVPTVTVAGAGDISSCSWDEDEYTAELLDNITGTVVTFGDNTQVDGTEDEFNNCFGPTWGRHKSQMSPTPGNHSYHTADASGYFNYFGPAAGEIYKGYYSYDVGNWHLIALNGNCTQIGGGSGCAVGSDQETWLRADLTANEKPCVMAYWHQPRFSSGGHGNNTNVGPLWEALYDYGADLVFNGHDHHYERFALQDPDANADSNGIREFVVGTGGGGLGGFGVPEANSEVRDSSSHGVIKLVLGENSYTWEFVPIAGDTFTETGSGTCH